MKKVLIASAVIVLAQVCAFAVDGVVLINQSTVMAAGGFPYVIDQPGSYKLSGNLSVPLGQDAIHIQVPKVTIDLNGFSITIPGPVSPLVFGIRYTGTPAPNSIAIHSGTLYGFQNPLLLVSTGTFCQNCTLTDLNLFLPAGSNNLSMGNWTRVENVTGLSVSISVICPSVVANSVFATISQANILPGDPNPPNQGTCTFVNNATQF